MAQRWKLTLEYDGRGFSGWQRQAGRISVQQVLEEAIARFSGEEITAHVAGRTDAGVHARAQVAHIDLSRATDSHTLESALNFHVRPHPVAVISALPVSERFHARFEARERSYLYRIVNRRTPLTFDAGLAWQCPHPLDEVAMAMAAQILPGHHDFSTFRAANCQSNGPLKTLNSLTVERIDDEILIRTAARSFLYHQVRNMVGTLVLVGTGKWSVDDFASAFAAADRARGGPTAPPDGLYFMGASYAQFDSEK